MRMQGPARFGRSLLLATVAWLGITASPEANATDETCSDIKKGDVAACNAKVTRVCTQPDNWERHNCELKVAPEFDLCEGGELAKAVAVAGSTVEDAKASSMPRNPDLKELEPWISRANRIEAEVAAYPRLFEEWKMCTASYPFSEEEVATVRNAVSHYQKAYAEEVDYVLRNAKENMTSGGEDKEEGKPGFAMSSWAKERIAVLEALSARLPASWRYRNQELEGARVQSAKNEKALSGWGQAQIAARRCPAGNALAGPFLAIVRREFDSDKNVKRRIYRQTGARYNSRDGLISRDNIPVTLCTERAINAAHSCETTNLTIFRDKPPGGAWTSWRLAVGGGDEFNCKKF